VARVRSGDPEPGRLRLGRRPTEYTVATLPIHPETERSLGVARWLGFVARGGVDGELFFARDV